MAQNDLLEQVNANGPFSQQLQAPTYEGYKQPVSGYAGGGTSALNIADHFLAGLSKGKAAAYNRSMQEKQQTFTAISGQIQQLQQSDLPPEIKAQQLAKLNDARGHVFLNALDDGKGGSSKGKKGGGQSSEGDDNHPGPHIMNAVKSIVTGMLGPGKQPGTVDPKELQELMTQTNQLIGQAPQISAQHLTQQVTSVNQALSPLVKANNGQLPTFSKAMSDPGFVSTLAKTIRPDGSYPPPVQSTIDAMQAREKEQQASDLLTQRDAAAEKRQDLRDTAAQTRTETSAKAAQQREDSRNAELDKRQAVRDKYQSQLVQAETSKNYAEAGVAREKLKSLQTENAAFSAAPDDPKYVSALKVKAATNPSLPLAAWNYLANDKFDTRGLGKDAHKDIEEIKGYAGIIMNQFGFQSGDIFEMRAGMKSNMGALSKVTSQSAQVEQFEGMLNRNLDTLQVLDKANPRYNVQLANRVQQAFKTGKGDPEALNMAAQLHGTSREWAKLMAGNTSASGASVSDSRDTDEILNKAMSSGQMNSLINNVIRVDAKNRIDSNNEEISKLRDRIRGVAPRGNDSNTPPATPQANTAPPQAAAGNTTPPTAAQQPGPPQANRPSLDDIFKKKK